MTEEESHAILEDLEYNNDQCPSKRRIMKKYLVTLEMESMKAHATQVGNLTKIVNHQKESQPKNLLPRFNDVHNVFLEQTKPQVHLGVPWFLVWASSFPGETQRFQKLLEL